MFVETNGFAIGDIAQDEATELIGRITAFTQYATGCARVALQPKVDKDGKVPDPYWTDVLSLSLVEAGPQHVIDAEKGGPPAGYGLAPSR
mgnify:CR=1 FL=1